MVEGGAAGGCGGRWEETAAGGLYVGAGMGGCARLGICLRCLFGAASCLALPMPTNPACSSTVLQVLKRDKDDLDARYDRAMLYADMGENRKAIEGLEQVSGMESKQPLQAGRRAGRQA